MTLKLKDIAKRINAHLKRIGQKKLMPGLHGAGAYYMGGARIRLTYVSREGGTTISRPKAVAYLDWLDAGHVGHHYDRVRPNVAASTKKLDGGTP